MQTSCFQGYDLEPAVYVLRVALRREKVLVNTDRISFRVCLALAERVEMTKM